MHLDSYVAKTLDMELPPVGESIDLESKEVKELIKEKIKAAEKSCKRFTFDKPTMTQEELEAL